MESRYPLTLAAISSIKGDNEKKARFKKESIKQETEALKQLIKIIKKKNQ